MATLKPLNRENPEFYRPVETPKPRRGVRYTGAATDFYHWLVAQPSELCQQIREDFRFPRTCGSRDPRIMQRYMLKSGRYQKSTIREIQDLWEVFVDSR